MALLNKIVEGCSLKVDGKEYKVLGKALYVAQSDPEALYSKIMLEGHHVLVIVPSDEVAYFGKNEGQLIEFDSYAAEVAYNEKIYKQVNHDYQIIVELKFGSPLEVEGEVEYWDYEVDDLIISIAVTSREKKRADVVARYISFDEIDVV